ncbi:ArsR family transcriptional regulator [Nonomuraea sp. NPDC049750]|uniref:ArsR family transcriptional regulator n=1 Tax=Nonomuraea sp. NPDC049750 TaxID=3154738 RepID=UPI0033E2A2F6
MAKSTLSHHLRVLRDAGITRTRQEGTRCFVAAALSLAVALARAAVVARLRRLLPHVSRASGALLTLAGLYVLYYGWYELRVFAGADADDPIVGAATAVQATIAGWVGGLGPGWIAAVLILLALAALAVRTARRGDRAR